ncbi:alpha-2-HS-glycoprotein 2 [Lampris incognitus]|uniref:alpha-2-HS-glycoprotein 2 n=1 Tax=Lampris incognitus TaxID=2546036 RepID=UPI0024B5D64A|nr:alpha-2-HS-glycoprotein 2 [Lampris incognitus]
MKMNFLAITVVFGLLVGALTQVVPDPLPAAILPPCDSHVVEAAALVAQDYLNAQHTHGYKYALNRIEDVKIISKPDGNDTYILEVDLLETTCHVLDPTPVANCSVRTKVHTSVEGDCDVILKNANGVLSVTAFKCKTEESTEDMCLGCPTLLPFNDTAALAFVHTSLATFNNLTVNSTFTLMEVGRVSSQIVSGGSMYVAEYVIVEANCTDADCIPLADATAQRGFCTAKGSNLGHTVDCNMFAILTPPVDVNGTAASGPALPPVGHGQAGVLPAMHGHRYHKLTSLHDPNLSGLLSAESFESDEVVPVAPAVILAADPAPPTDSSASVEAPAVVKREAPAPDPTVYIPIFKAAPIFQGPRCPGRIRHF